MKSSCLHTSQKPTTTTCGYTSIIPIHIESDRRWSTYKHDLEQELLQRLLDQTNQGKRLTTFAQRRWLAAALDHPPLVEAFQAT
jgi:hypothetical protein